MHNKHRRAELIKYLEYLEGGEEFLQSQDPVASKVRDKLAEVPITEIVTQLESFWRTSDQDDWRYDGKDLIVKLEHPELIERSIAGVRGSSDITENFDEFEYEELAEELLEKLNQIWGDSL